MLAFDSRSLRTHRKVLISHGQMSNRHLQMMIRLPLAVLLPPIPNADLSRSEVDSLVIHTNLAFLEGKVLLAVLNLTVRRLAVWRVQVPFHPTCLNVVAVIVAAAAAVVTRLQIFDEAQGKDRIPDAHSHIQRP